MIVISYYAEMNKWLDIVKEVKMNKMARLIWLK